MKNIELKIKISNLKEIERLLKKSRALYQGILKQKDIYFKCKVGKLKIRKIDNSEFQLIYYQRSNKADKKISNYTIVELNKQQANKLVLLFTKLFGQIIIISKSRRLWLYKDTRIHLDKVNKLGSFLELETVLKNISKKQGINEYDKIYKILNLNNYQKIKKSYSDLLKLNNISKE